MLQNLEKSAWHVRTMRPLSRLPRLQLLILTLVISVPVWAGTLTLNLNNADIRVLINTVSEMTGKNFIVDPRVKGKVTVISSSPSNRDHIYEIFLSVLKVHGFAVVPSGDVYKIVPNTIAKQDNIRTLSEVQIYGTDEIVTQVIEVKHVSASQLLPILRPLMPQQAHLGVHASSNTLIISDTIANLNRIMGIISRIDRIGNREVEVIPLVYATAADLVQVLNSLRSAGGQKGQPPPGQQPTLVADPRTNSILLGGNPELRLEIRALIAHLDTPVTMEGNTEVIYLRYAQAKDLMTVLSGIGTKQLEAEKELKKGASAKPQFDIQADEATNALVITAPPPIMRSLKNVINQLDIRRAQVYIEAVIAELTDEKTAELGVKWQSNTPVDKGYFVGTSQPSINLTDARVGFNLGYFSGGSLRALVQAFAGDTDTNILSTPSLLTLDNEKATIHVGENVPFVTGQYTTTGGSGDSTTPFQTIERQDVGLKLSVTPQINEGDTIKLEIEQEVSSVATRADVEGLTTKKRTLETTILVDDKQTIVLGGLIKDNLKETVSKVPLLGDIPLLGHLFRSTSTTSNKTNLMIFLRPEIIRNRNTSLRLTNTKYNYIRQMQRSTGTNSKSGGINLLPNRDYPLMPALRDGQPTEVQESAPQTDTNDNNQTN
ncbi:General secretion pathway protein D [hydrothermal vent metagenome]|uniref:General secretion pathway protein D n=1 Tax=hydrothermal vent metagenome TaxID=652676 RepID=A0A3B1BY29_9ZZZZ